MTTHLINGVEWTEAQMRVAIAEACGWEGLSGEWPFTTGLPKYWQGAESREPLPDYLHDLNAMHEAEKVFHDGRGLQRWWDYMDALADNFQEFGNGSSIHATALQRAIAFIQTLNIQPPTL